MKNIILLLLFVTVAYSQPFSPRLKGSNGIDYKLVNQTAVGDSIMITAADTNRIVMVDKDQYIGGFKTFYDSIEVGEPLNVVGVVRFSDGDQGTGRLLGALGGSYNWRLPVGDGTLARTSDIPVVITDTNRIVDTDQAQTITGAKTFNARPYLFDGLKFYGDLNDGSLVSPSLTDIRTWTLPNTTGTIALTDGNQNFNDVANITADSIKVSGGINADKMSDFDSIQVGIATAEVGVIRLSDGASGYARIYNSANSAHISLPSESGEMLVSSRSGIATVGGGDSVQVSYTGFTTDGIVMLTYEGGNIAYTKIPVVGYKRTDGFTIYADASFNVAWFVVKKGD